MIPDPLGVAALVALVLACAVALLALAGYALDESERTAQDARADDLAAIASVDAVGRCGWCGDLVDARHGPPEQRHLVEAVRLALATPSYVRPITPRRVLTAYQESRSHRR